MSYPIDGGLNLHRLNLKNNPECFFVDKTRAKNNWCKEVWNFYKKQVSIKKRDAIILIEELSDLVWEAQGGKPLFQFDSHKGLPMSWNRPQDGELNYIRYEIGHMTPRLSGGTSHPNNLTFQSSRCNQHIQSSLDIDEVLVYFKQITEVNERYNNLIELHNSNEWNKTLGRIII